MDDRQWKEQNLASGYATHWDRKTARAIRQRQADGIDVTPEQIAFAERVYQIVESEITDPLPGLKRVAPIHLVTKDQLLGHLRHWGGQPPAKKEQLVITLPRDKQFTDFMGDTIRITVAKVKSTERKPLYAVEFCKAEPFPMIRN